VEGWSEPRRRGRSEAEQLGGQRDVDALGREPRVDLRPLEVRLPRLDRLLDRLAGGVQGHSDSRSRTSRSASFKLGLAAEVLDAHVVEGAEVRGGPDGGERLLRQRLRVHGGDCIRSISHCFLLSGHGSKGVRPGSSCKEDRPSSARRYPGSEPGRDKGEHASGHCAQTTKVAEYDTIARLYDPWSASVVEDISFYVDEALASGGPSSSSASARDASRSRSPQPALTSSASTRRRRCWPSAGRGRGRPGSSRASTYGLGDLRHPPVEGPVPLVTCPFRAYLHLASDEERLEAFGAAHALLEDDGRLIFDVFSPSQEDIDETQWTLDRTRAEDLGARRLGSQDFFFRTGRSTIRVFAAGAYRARLSKPLVEASTSRFDEAAVRPAAETSESRRSLSPDKELQ